MTELLIYSALSLGGVAAGFAVVLYIISQRFKVEEDPRIGEVTELLPGINCGACGYPGCSGLAEALVDAADEGDISHLTCPPGGADTMKQVGRYFGLEVGSKHKTLAVLRCGGSFAAAPAKNEYQGPETCAIAHSLYVGVNGCPHSCLRLADCEVACPFDAIEMNDETGLPEVIPELCTSCGACVKACPRDLFEIRPRGKGKAERRVWINCRNKQPGGIARKNCSVACIGCGKCVRVCNEIVQAISMEDNLAYIDPYKCISCGKCVPVCPTKAILATFTPPKPKEPKKETADTQA